MEPGLTGEALDCALQASAWSYWGRNLNPSSEVPIWQLYYATNGAHQTMMNFYAERNSTAAQNYPAS